VQVEKVLNKIKYSLCPIIISTLLLVSYSSFAFSPKLTLNQNIEAFGFVAGLLLYFWFGANLIGTILFSLFFWFKSKKKKEEAKIILINIFLVVPLLSLSIALVGFFLFIFTRF
jgi:hypothetical protein